MNAPLVDTSQSVLKGQISISEIFGPTIQGEGALIGTPTVFIRIGGCDYRCKWCDTAYAVLPEFEKDWKLMDSISVFEKVETLSQHQPLWITLSGGNPAIQDLEALIILGQSKGYKFSMETQGSISKPWFSLLDQITLSPKPPSTEMSFKKRGLERCFDACGDIVNGATSDIDNKVSLKFVIANQEDLLWAKQIADTCPTIPCFLQACNTNASINQQKSEVDSEAKDINSYQQKDLLNLIESAQALHWHNVRILPQLHTWLWGDKKGV